jgi:predicted exporter
VTQRKKLRRGLGNRSAAMVGDNAAEVARKQRQARALELRVQGASYRMIANELGINVQTAHSDVRLAIAESGATPEQVEHAREVLNARLNQSFLRLNGAAAVMLRRATVERRDAKGKLVSEGDPESARALAAIVNAQTRVIAQAARLNGVDVPVTQHVVVEHDVRSKLMVLVGDLSEERRRQLLEEGRARDEKLRQLETGTPS